MVTFDVVRLLGLLGCTLGAGVTGGYLIATIAELRDAKRPASSPGARGASPLWHSAPTATTH